jgi:hypothetical protein
MPVRFHGRTCLLHRMDYTYPFSVVLQRMNKKPKVGVEIATTISGVYFGESYAERVVDVLDSVKVNLISLKHLKTNKKSLRQTPGPG